eukprot:2561735-Prymnesium_polylepis.1
MINDAGRNDAFAAAIGRAVTRHAPNLVRRHRAPRVLRAPLLHSQRPSFALSAASRPLTPSPHPATA